MRYGLLLTTHGDAPFLDETLTSFERWVTPQPDVKLAVVDGPDALLPTIRGDGGWWIRQAASQYGFCKTVRSAWVLARDAIEENRLDYVFWLENDFRFLRPVDVTLLAYTLGRFQHLPLAQMALLRLPVNRRERDAGGVLAAYDVDPIRHMGWLEHRRYWTTNPSLIPNRMFAHDWPDGPECEGKFGIQLVEAGYSFGFWGDGDAWVEHLGDRSADGKGY